jgi:hypothetical protein
MTARLTTTSWARTFLASTSFLILILPNGCLKKQKSALDAFEIKRGNSMNRLYAAYDLANPLALSWYLCRDENHDPNTSVTVTQTGDLQLGVRISQALKGLAPIDPTDTWEPSVQGVQNPGAAFSNNSANLVERQRNIRLIERTTTKDFETGTSGGSCKPIVKNLSRDESREKVESTFEKKSDVDTSVLMFGSLIACIGFGKEALLTTGVVTQPLRGKPKNAAFSALGFTKPGFSKANLGETIWTLATGLIGCSLTSRGLFSKVSEHFTLVDENRAALFRYFDEVTQKSDTLLKASNWSNTLSSEEMNKLSGLKGEMSRVESQFETVQQQLQLASSYDPRYTNLVKTYGQIYNPLFVATWNAVMQETVIEDASLQGTLMTRILNGMNGVLTNVSNFVTGKK